MIVFVIAVQFTRKIQQFNRDVVDGQIKFRNDVIHQIYPKRMVRGRCLVWPTLVRCCLLPLVLVLPFTAAVVVSFHPGISVLVGPTVLVPKGTSFHGHSLLLCEIV